VAVVIERHRAVTDDQRRLRGQRSSRRPCHGATPQSALHTVDWNAAHVGRTGGCDEQFDRFPRVWPRDDETGGVPGDLDRGQSLRIEVSASVAKLCDMVPDVFKMPVKCSPTPSPLSTSFSTDVLRPHSISSPTHLARLSLSLKR